ncbi:phage portal protein [Paenactinomyces guangxiensis]|uniref:Phage portal protein n=1 Tax=Paenactinomyces guangxiensis TaxID=1490290 RepID=A0A7W2A811_9BACL|nr:phage portal protein [Paenactinomyces guangxiensis]MBA4495106.1 phage portal protein [Paenactinomyces guangxiensis]MBH8592210.1 phage portal protein [Paenactinomyces guangxiensis]
MGFWSKVFGLVSYGRKSILDVRDYDDGRQVYNPIKTNEEIMLAISWVYTCVRLLATSVKRTPLRVYQGNGDNELIGDPLAKILQRPNPFMTGRQLLEGTQTWKELNGNAYWFLEDIDGRGRPKNIWLLDSRHMAVVPDKQEMIRGYVYEVNGKQIPLDKDEVLHFKNFNPFNPYYGLGTLQGIAAMLETEQYRSSYDKAFFKNGAKLSGVLTTPDTIPEHTFEQLKREVKQMFRGVNNFHKVAVLQKGLEFKEISLSQKDMEFLGMAKFNRDQILAAFGVPPAKIGIMENANYSNSEEQDRTFWSETMAPRLMDLQDVINNELAPRFGNNHVEFDEMVKEDEEANVNQAVALKEAGILTVNEVRERLGYDPMPKGDEITLPEPKRPTPEDEEGAKAWKSITDSFQRSRIAYLALAKKIFVPDIINFFNEQEKRVLNRLLARKAYQFIPNELWDQLTEDEQLAELMRVLHITVAKSAYEKAGSWFEEDLRFDLDNPKHAELIQNLGRKITRINETTRKAVIDQVTEGMRRGYSINQIAHGNPEENFKGIAGVFEQARGYRAEMIARSESADAYNLADLLAYEELGQSEVYVLDGVDWDEECRRANGQVWSIEKARANPKDHPNCTRAFAPYVDLDGLSFEEIARKEGEEWAEKMSKKMLRLPGAKK